MTPSQEVAYSQGNAAAWQQILSLALRNLGVDDPKAGEARWVSERAAAIQSLRNICRDHGDNEWDDDLHLQDILDKHLMDHLDN